jgi:hypothetical protein
MPPISEEARKTRIETALESLSPEAERIPVPWQDSGTTFPVITIPLDAVVLNPKSHRIRAQLESHPQRSLVEQSPYSEQAQEVVTEILHNTEGFERLKTNLEEEGQRDAGVITRAGLLVNGNTRAAALRDIGKQYIRAAVLPGDATQQEIDELELRLQMKRDLKQEYTFTNELLFVDELITRYNRSVEQIAFELRWATSRSPKELDKGKERVRQSVRILNVIRQLQVLSGSKLPLTDFDEKRQALIEVDEEYQRLRQVDPDKASKVRDTRMIGVLVGLGYRELRQIDDRFLDDYFVPALTDTKSLGKYADALTTQETTDEDLPGLDILPSPSTEPDRAAEPLLRLIAASATDDQVEVPGDAERVTLPRDQLIDVVRGTMEEAADTARLDKKAEGQRGAPILRLQSAERELRRALEAYRRIKTDSSFDHGRLKQLFAQLKRTVESFADELSNLA